ncbi:MAG: DUF5009 domain-containing protein [Thermoguttaceae bacterium]|nr:DUF5009 domain-containing protein [Thermoguttaceae bacterium]
MSSATIAPAIPVKNPVSERLVSLDALRGFDIFLLLMLGIVGKFASGPMPGLIEGKSEACVQFWQRFASHFEHVGWEGFTLCDLAMPLFVFMAGAAIPFSLSRYVRGEDKRWGRLWLRIIRRVVVLWIFGMAVQGQLLTLQPEKFRLFSNTLQSIAVGYFFSCLAYLYLPKWARFVAFVVLLLAFWACMKFITVGGSGETEGLTEWTMNWITARGCGGGSYAEGTNLAYWVDCQVLGRTMDYASVNDAGEVVFRDFYQYTWILSSLTFVATALSGMFGGELLYSTREKIKSLSSKDSKGRRLARWQACALLVVSGGLCFLFGLFWNAAPEGSFVYCPIIKHIWTPSMVLYSSGVSLLLLGLCYAVFDILRPWQAGILLAVLGAIFFLLGILWYRAPEDSLAYLSVLARIWQYPLALCELGAWLLLAALFYAPLASFKLPSLKTFLVVFGTNAIAAYMLSHIFNFKQIVESVLYGCEFWLDKFKLGAWYSFLLEVAAAALIWAILHSFWKRGKFLRV